MLSEDEESSEPVSKKTRTARASSFSKKKVDIKKEDLSDEEPEAKPIRRTKRAAILKMKEEPATDDEEEEEVDEDEENYYIVKEKKIVKPQTKDVKVEVSNIFVEENI